MKIIQVKFVRADELFDGCDELAEYLSDGPWSFGDASHTLVSQEMLIGELLDFITEYAEEKQLELIKSRLNALKDSDILVDLEPQR